jgi:hypothetical protein
MKHFFFIATFLCFVVAARAQQPDSLKEYTGTYKLGPSDDQSDATVEILNGKLSITGRSGSATLTREKADSFSVDQYGGSVIFSRDNSTKKINHIKIDVPAGGINVEGVKVETEKTDLTMIHGAHRSKAMTGSEILIAYNKVPAKTPAKKEEKK